MGKKAGKGHSAKHKKSSAKLRAEQSHAKRAARRNARLEMQRLERERKLKERSERHGLVPKIEIQIPKVDLGRAVELPKMEGLGAGLGMSETRDWKSFGSLT